MKAKTVLVVVATATIVFGLLVFKRKSAVSPSTTPANSSESSVLNNETKLVTPQEGLPSRMSPEEVKVWSKQDLAERQLELERLVLPKEGADSVLNIELKILPSCFPGDADAISMDLNASPNHQLLGTLEGMSVGTLSFSWNVPKELFSTGIARNKFKIRATKEPIQLGFYLCTSKGGGSCQGKKARDLNEIFTEHLTKKPNAGQEERMIFYQYFLLDEQGLRVFSGVPRGKSHFDKLKKYAAERGFQGQNVNEGIDKAQEAIETLMSLPVKFEKNNLILSLPKFDAVACSQMEKNVKKATPRVKPADKR